MSELNHRSSPIMPLKYWIGQVTINSVRWVKSLNLQLRHYRSLIRICLAQTTYFVVAACYQSTITPRSGEVNDQGRLLTIKMILLNILKLDALATALVTVN